MITGNILRDAIISGANCIANNRVRVDRLNVFPVPDGDTGTNMMLSVGAAAKELKRMSDKPVSDAADIAASALLRGARGNSGVILSLLFRGFSKAFHGLDTADASALANAMTSGVEAAYKAVMKPTEGTILTVSKEAAAAAESAAKKGRDFIEAFETALNQARITLEKTPEMLPVLKKAGVVDAGGQGLIHIYEGMLSVFKDNAIIQKQSEEQNSEEAVTAADVWDESFTYFYCTEFIVNKKENAKDTKALRAYLETIGDSVVVVDDANIIKAHVHTDDPGNALQEALKFGSLSDMKIENMYEQNMQMKEDAGGQKTSEGYEIAPKTNDFGFVAVAAGKGIEALFVELGCEHIVIGGQTMNPSTDDILKAVEMTPAKAVYVMPNNKNIIMAAEQAARLATREVVVLNTRSIPMGISAMLHFDPDSTVDENAINMQKAANHVGTGQVTFAVRDSEFDGHKIKKGQYLALKNGKVSFVDSDLTNTVVKLTKALYNKESQFVTIIYGADVTEKEAEIVRGMVEAKISKDAEITLIAGEQPVYYYIISVE